MFKIVERRALNPTVTKLVIHAPLIAKKAQPGQFIIVRPFEDSERIPLTVADYDREKRHHHHHLPGGGRHHHGAEQPDGRRVRS